MGPPEPPEEVHRFIEGVLSSLYANFSAMPFRYVSTWAEPGLWVAYGGFDPCEKSGSAKVSMTLNPLLSAEMASLYPVFIWFAGVDYLVVSYTSGIEQLGGRFAGFKDPLSGDYIFPYEYEVAVYCGESSPVTKTNIYKVRFVRGVRADPELISRAKAFAYWAVGRPASRHVYTLFRSMDEVVDSLAVVAASVRYTESSRFWLDFAYVWDRYWQEKGLPLASEPDYETYRFMARQAPLECDREWDAVRWRTCDLLAEYAMDEDTCMSLVDRAIEKLKELEDAYRASGVYVYNRWGEAALAWPRNERLARMAERLLAEYPDVFKSMAQAVSFLKWLPHDDWKTVKASVEALRAAKYRPKVLIDSDPDITPED